MKLTADLFGDDNVLALFNTRLFPEKSYPKVDQAFCFFPSRYQEFFYENAQIDDAEPPPVRQGVREPTFNFLRQRLPERFALLEQARQGLLGANAAARVLAQGRFLERLVAAAAEGLQPGGSNELIPYDELIDDGSLEPEQVHEIEQPRPIVDGPFGEIGFGQPRAGRLNLIPAVLREAIRDIGRIGVPQQTIEELRVMFGVPDGVDFTIEDFQALARLQTAGNGVDRRTIVAVYQACDRNEAITQNCLMSMH
jgi:hypothetical protein